MAVVTHSAPPSQQRQEGNPKTVYYRRLPESALSDRNLTRSALALLAQLDGFARDKTECWPSVGTLMKALGLSRRTIQLALARLKEHGYISEKPAKNPTGRVLILLWRTGGAISAAPRAQAPYSQGLPGGAIRRHPKESQAGEGKKAVRSALFQTPEPGPSPRIRVVEPPPTRAERAETMRNWLDALPPGSPSFRTMATRLAEHLKM